MGDYRPFDTSTDLSVVGNGFAQAAVTEDVLGGFSAIDVARTDAVYANGDDSADTLEYIRVFDSATLGYNGVVSGPQTYNLEVYGAQAATSASEPGSIALLLTAGLPVVGLLHRRMKH